MRSPRYWTVIVLLAVTAVLLHTRGDTDYVPPRQPLAQVPTAIGPWNVSRDISLSQDTLDVLGQGDFLNRDYGSSPTVARSAAGTQPQSSINSAVPVNLFIGYFPTQRTGQTIHSPQHCLPGAGWTFESSRYVNIPDVNGKLYNVGEYVISNGEARQFVIYWYQAHGRSIANEYKAKLYMVGDAIRTNRTDGALVRIITTILPSEPVSSARDRALHFAGQLAPLLPQFIPD
ncbi:MAG TPA: EpsI family protein [Edaphobacter sp.]